MRLGRTAELCVNDSHGRYYEPTYRKVMYSGGNAAGVTSTVGVATTYVGLCLANPPTSTVNLVVNKVGFTALVAWPAASIIGIMTGISTTAVVHSTPVVPAGNFVGQLAGQGTLDSSATLPIAPTLRTVLSCGLTGAITVQTFAGGVVDMEGSLVIPPGGFAALFTSTVSAASGFAGSFQWEEVPV